MRESLEHTLKLPGHGGFVKRMLVDMFAFVLFGILDMFMLYGIGSISGTWEREATDR